jgi:hypothetical protein
VVTVASPVGGTTLTAPYQGAISFDRPAISASGLPQGSVRAGTPVTATISVHNNGPGTEDVFADPRTKGSETDALASLDQATGLPLPIPGDVPRRSSSSRPRPTRCWASRRPTGRSWARWGSS